MTSTKTKIPLYPRLTDVAKKYPQIYEIGDFWENPNLTLEEIKSIRVYKNHIHNIIHNPNCTRDFVLSHLQYITINNWDYVAKEYNIIDVKNLIFDSSHINEDNYEEYKDDLEIAYILNSDEINIYLILGWLDDGISLGWDTLSDSNYNFNITLDDIETNIDLPWDWKIISERNDLTINFIKKHVDILDWTRLTVNKYVNMNDILQNDTLPWDWFFVTDRLDYDGIHGINVKYISSHMDYKWNWEELSSETNVNVISQYPKLPWNWNHISFNKTLNIIFVINHIKQLNKYLGNIIKILPIKKILENKYLFTDFRYFIIQNKSLTFQTLKEFSKSVIYALGYSDLHTLIENDNFSLDELYYLTQLVMDKNPGYFNENILSESPNLTPRYILSHPEISWDKKLNTIASNSMNYEKRKKWSNHLQELYLKKLNKRVQSHMIDKNYLGANVLTNIVMEYK